MNRLWVPARFGRSKRWLENERDPYPFRRRQPQSVAWGKGRSTLLECAVIVLMCSSFVALSGTMAEAVPFHPATSPLPGYWLITGGGGSYAFNAPNLGSPDTYGSDLCVNAAASGTPPYSCNGVSSAPNGTGYWISSGSTGSAPYPVSPGYLGAVGVFGTGVPVGNGPSVITSAAAQIVDVAAAPAGAWLVASDGGVFGMLGAPFYGSMGGRPLNAPIVGIAPTPDGQGYWEVASDGGIFSFGDATFYGSMGGRPLNEPIVGMAATPDGRGYWEMASDGGIFAFGDAGFFGSMGGKNLVAPMVGIAANPDGTGYWTVAADGGIFAFGDAPYLGSAAGQVLSAPIVGMAAMPAGANPTPAPPLP